MEGWINIFFFIILFYVTYKVRRNAGCNVNLFRHFPSWASSPSNVLAKLGYLENRLTDSLLIWHRGTL